MKTICCDSFGKLSEGLEGLIPTVGHWHPDCFRCIKVPTGMIKTVFATEYEGEAHG
jgi:hypothetical protein